MSVLADMVWVESRKAIRSRMPLATVLASLFMPLGIAFLIFVARNPDVSQRLGLVSAKANLMAYSTTDWPTYLGVLGQAVAAGGFFLLVLIVSWTFGREFVDGTLKDMLAVPVRRSAILASKFVVTALWFVALTAIIVGVGLLTGVAMGLPGGSVGSFLSRGASVAVVAGLVLAVTLPFALLASAGRGYLLPIGIALALLMAANLVAVIGLGEYFPWAVPMLYAQAKSPLGPISYGVALLTGAAGVLATYLWWKLADQSR